MENYVFLEGCSNWNLIDMSIMILFLSKIYFNIQLFKYLLLILKTIVKF